MKVMIRIAVVLFIFLSFLPESYGQEVKVKGSFPYKQQGLTEKEAIVHLLSRFTYGFDEQQIEKVEKQGLEKWFRQQLEGNIKDDRLNNLMGNYADVLLSNRAIDSLYPRSARVRRQAVNEGFISKDSIDNSKQSYKDAIRKFMEVKGYRPENELNRQFLASKIVRAVYSQNQLREVMTDFWFNHFNVSFTKGQAAPFIPNYEAYVIRPNALGNFQDLLLATAKAPAMLMYLDNFSSVADNPKSKGKKGLNENYARELMELHTLGVDGGYTQKDVTEAARVLTGWTIYPMQGYGNVQKENIANNKNNIADGDFLFLANRHDKGTKTVLEHTFNNWGYEEGVELLKMLASKPQTAEFIVRKLAVRFVSDIPSPELVKRMKDTFLKNNGDISAVLTMMVYSPEFWDKKTIDQKIKTPFELAISAVRGLDADVNNPVKLNNWVTRMGEQKYHYIAPTGFPDKSDYWINTGALLNRMNFGLSFTSENNSGVEVDLMRVTGGREPESAEQALEVFGRKLLPEADMDVLKKRLTPLLTQQDLHEKVSAASQKNREKSMMQDDRAQEQKISAKSKNQTNAMLAQIVGLIIGSPEFQRR
ncbi:MULTISPECIES: DUF1800 domain-containing protein [unclassified Sphingobacterium]|uniref:DUF1800 domain-containing protein n=1 Tax=unclassified Sphingobacterium TaxID=2609468 RepID=UPI0025E04363|nr:MULTISPECIES: DUF1800 domain-containing protein [unclassified Sphingobacterium]